MRRMMLESPILLGFEHRVKYPTQNVPTEATYPDNDEYVIIGRTINSHPERPAKLYKAALYRHILISGTTGSGKSFTASLLAKRVAEKLSIPVIIVDWQGEYSKLLDDYEVINPFETPLELFTGDPSDLSIISSVLELTSSQEYLLEKVIRKVDISKMKSIETFIDYLEAYPEESSWMRETKLSLHRKLSILARYGYDQLFKLYKNSGKNLQLVGKHTGKPFIVNVNRILDLSVRKLYSAFYVKKVVDSAISLSLPLLIVIEEAQNFLSKNQPVKPICDMLREVRKFQVGLVVISQSISQISEDVLVNTNTKIVHAVKSKIDLDILEKSLYLDENTVSVIPYLEPGEAVYSTPTLKKAVLIKVE
ncbi:MAG: ATP-binding protein [Desulfurococcaceae archaeon]